MKSLPSKRHLCFHQDDSQLCTIVKSQAFKSLFAYDILQVQLYTLAKSQPSKSVCIAIKCMRYLCTFVKSLPSKRIVVVFLDTVSFVPL